jgi:hypothetical protein
MFNNPAPVDKTLEEGTVTEIDAKRKLCRIKTMSGRNLNSVTWLSSFGGASRGSDRGTPLLGDRVLIDSRLGYPIIIGSAPRLQGSDNIFPLSIDQGAELVDTGSFSPANDNIIPDQNSPADMVSGDRILSSQGGGMVAILRGGSLLLRSSRLAEIFISKWDDVVRVVSRNWEHFTDASADTIKNIAGRVYRYTGYANTAAAGKIENYQYEQFIGDVGLAETSKDTYFDLSGATDTRIYKEQVPGVLTRQLYLDGTSDTKSGAGPFTRVKQTPAMTEITFNDTNLITIDTNKIFLSFNGNPTVTLSATGIKAVFGGATFTMDNNQIQAVFGGATFTMDGNGVASNFGGHFVNVTSGGVQFG